MEPDCAELTITPSRTSVADGVPTLYSARPEDSDGPQEFLACTFVGRKLVGRILYLYEGNPQYVDLNSNAHGGMRVVEELKTRRIMDVPVRTVYSRGTHEQISDRAVDPFR